MLRALRALLVTIGLSGLAVWLYVAIRIVAYANIPPPITILGVSVRFWVLGIIAFLISFASMILYVASRGLPRRRSMEKAQ